MMPWEDSVVVTNWRVHAGLAANNGLVSCESIVASPQTWDDG